MKLSNRVDAIKAHLRRHGHWECGSDSAELWRHVNELEAEVAQIEARLGPADATPASITVDAYTQDDQGAIMADQFAAGTPIHLHAAAANAEGQSVPDTVTWTTTAGTFTDEDPTTQFTTLVGAPVGTVTVTATDPKGITGSVTFDVIDGTPATITVTASA